MTSKSKEHKMHRKTADRLLEGLKKRIVLYNDNPTKPFMFTRVVVFGSYVNDPGREMLSDLDIGFEMKSRYEGKLGMDIMISEYYDIIDIHPSYKSTYLWPMGPWRVTYDSALRFLKNRSHYISFHPIGEDEAIFSDKTMELDVGKIDRDPSWYTWILGDDDD